MQHKMERFLKCAKKKILSNCFEGLYLNIPGQQHSEIRTKYQYKINKGVRRVRAGNINLTTPDLSPIFLWNSHLP